MKLKILLSILLWGLFGCTSGQLKEVAIQAAEKSYTEELRKEIEGILPQQHPLYETYVHYLVNSAEFQVEDLTKSTESLYLAQVLVKTTPQKNRKVLAEIAAKRKLEHEAKSFNLGTALILIEKQPGQIQGAEEKRYFMRLIQSGQGWRAEPMSSQL